MSTRKDLYAGLGPAGVELLGLGAQDMPVGTDEVREAMDAYRAEVLREARKEIIAAQAVTPDLKAREAWKSGYKAGLSMAAVITTP